MSNKNKIEKVQCEVHNFDESNNCTNSTGTHTLSYVYAEDCEWIRDEGVSPKAFINTLSICDDCFEFYQGPDDEMAFIDEIKLPCEYVLDYQEEVD